MSNPSLVTRATSWPRGRVVLATAAIFLRIGIGGSASAQPGAEAFERARASAEAENWQQAEDLAVEAIRLSDVFVPEKEIAFESNKQVLLDTMIQEATRAYRIRRSGYFALLGSILEKKTRWAEARKALNKAFFLDPSFALLESIASQPDLSPRDRYEYRVEGIKLFQDVSEQSSLERGLIASGAFLHRWALQASIDERRIDAVLEASPNYRFELGEFPEVRATTDAGTLVSAERLAAGHVVLFYFPSPGCLDCSEDLDTIGRAVEKFRRSKKMIDLAVFVPEVDLTAIRRIVRLLAIDMEVGRVEGLPPSMRDVRGELWLVARGGLSWIRRTLEEDRLRGTLGREVERILGYLDETGLPTEDDVASYHKPLVEMPSADQSWRDWLEVMDDLEIGPIAPADGYRALTQKLRADFRDRESDRAGLLSALSEVSRLQFAGDAKSFLLGRLQPRILEAMLDRARELVPALRRASGPLQAPMFLSVSQLSEARNFILVQKSFATMTGELHHVDFLLAPTGDGLEIRWAAESLSLARGTSPGSAGAVFHHQLEDGCQGIRLVPWEGAGTLYEGCPAVIIEGSPREVRPVLVGGPASVALDDSRDAGPASVLPVYYAGVAKPSASSLETGIDAYRAGDFQTAEAAFERAMSEIDPVAPYYLSDVRYNRARAAEASGQLPRALELYRQIGDVSYQDWITVRMRAIEDPARRQ